VAAAHLYINNYNTVHSINTPQYTTDHGILVYYSFRTVTFESVTRKQLLSTIRYLELQLN